MFVCCLTGQLRTIEVAWILSAQHRNSSILHSYSYKRIRVTDWKELREGRHPQLIPQSQDLKSMSCSWNLNTSLTHYMSTLFTLHPKSPTKRSLLRYCSSFCSPFCSSCCSPFCSSFCSSLGSSSLDSSSLGLIKLLFIQSKGCEAHSQSRAEACLKRFDMRCRTIAHESD